MDIIDIILAKALTPQGQVETYAAKAQKAAQDAAAAEASAEAVVSNIESITEQTNANNEAAAQALVDVQAALEALNDVDTITINDVDAEVKKMRVDTNVVNGNAANTLQVITTYPDNTLNTQNITKLYKNTGNNEDGTMTQKAITAMLAEKADASTAATKEYVDTAIAAIPTGSGSGEGGGTTNLGDENNGKIVVVGSDGNITSGTVTEEDIVEALILGGGYTAQDAVGLEVNYDNKSFLRTQQAVGKAMGNDFDSYLMYGGRRRCNVADDGTINAFYGENGYTEDGSNGQVMVYQPKFYYQRIPISTTNNKIGKVVVRDSFMVSYVAQNGFKLHPIFTTPTGEELDYVLFSAYEGGLYDSSENTYVTDTASNVDFNNDKLSSVSGTKPITGTSGLSLQKAEQLANNRGNGWHIYTLAAESANQLLEIIEFGSMNGQASLGKGVCNLVAQSPYNQAALTGATASLGNASGAASTTTIETNGSIYTTTDDDKVSISYRGVENPWGNVWQMINGIIVYGNNLSNGGVPYICKNFNYSYNALSNNYESTEFSLPNDSSWISALGYGSKKYDWVLMPAVCNSDANSALPIGDNGWFDSNLVGIRMVVQGGGWSFAESDGLFYYGCDKPPTDSSYRSYGARLLYLPTKNEIYTANIAKWQTEMNIGG